MADDIWGYAAAAQYTPGTSLVGYRVEATDGHIGKVHEATDDVGAAYIVVDTGPWIFGRHVVLPAGTITRIVHDDRTVRLGLTKHQINASPPYDPATHQGDPAYRQALGTYYGSQNR